MPVVDGDGWCVLRITVHMNVLRTDVAITGGGLGACAAALAAARLGRRVSRAEETHWIGGQLMNQAVPPDEHPWIDGLGATALIGRCAVVSGITTFSRNVNRF